MTHLFVRNKVKQAMKSRGWTQKELADATGLGQTQISRISDTKKKSVNRDHIAKVADALGITDINELIELEVIDSEVEDIGNGNSQSSEEIADSEEE